MAPEGFLAFVEDDNFPGMSAKPMSTADTGWRPVLWFSVSPHSVHKLTVILMKTYHEQAEAVWL